MWEVGWDTDVRQRLNCAAAYDSFYLALAESSGCEPWAVDRRLCGADRLPWLRSVEESQPVAF